MIDRHWMDRLPKARGWLATLLLALAAAVAPLGGCGGGVGEGGTGYAAGPITGFGSIIVNDIAFDDSAARIEDGEGNGRGRSDLKLGMTVEVDSEAIRDGGSRAARVRYDSAIVGPVERVDPESFVVLGQRVAVDETTVFDTALAAGLSALAPGQIVEVYGLFDAGLQRLRATRVELRTAALVFRLRGVVAEIDDRLRTLRVGTARFAYAAGSLPQDVVLGSFVRLVVEIAPDGLGRFPVQRFGEAQRALPDADGASVKGFISQLDSQTSFRVDGRRVDASAAAITGGPLALGLRVEVIGGTRAGVVIASRVEVRSDQFERDRGFDIRGEIESVAGDRRSLVLRGLTIGLTRADLRFDNGSAAELAAGRSIEVRAVVAPGNGAVLDAVRLKFR
jgi:hypothetical protein